MPRRILWLGQLPPLAAVDDDYQQKKRGRYRASRRGIAGREGRRSLCKDCRQFVAHTVDDRCWVCDLEDERVPGSESHDPSGRAEDH